MSLGARGAIGRVVSVHGPPPPPLPDVAAATVKRLLASTVAPELLSPYTPLMGAALGDGAATGLAEAPTTARGRSVGGGGALTRRETSARARSRSRGRTVVAWRDQLDAQRRGLQAGVARAVASSSAAKTVAQLSFDLGVELDWEYVMMRLPSDDAAFAGASAGAAQDEGTHSSAFGLAAGGDSRAGGGKRDDDGPEAAAGGGGAAGGGTARLLPMAAATGDLPLEVDGEHTLDLPQSWCPRLVSPERGELLSPGVPPRSSPQALDRYVAKVALGASDSRTVNYFRARLDTFIPHTQPTGLIARLSSFGDTAKTMVDSVIEVFSRRKDGEQAERGYVSGLRMPEAECV